MKILKILGILTLFINSSCNNTKQEIKKVSEEEKLHTIITQT